MKTVRLVVAADHGSVYPVRDVLTLDALPDPRLAPAGALPINISEAGASSNGGHHGTLLSPPAQRRSGVGIAVLWLSEIVRVVDCEQRRRSADHRIGADRRGGRAHWNRPLPPRRER